MPFDDRRMPVFGPGRIDPWTAVLPCVLAFWGVVMVFSATAVGTGDAGIPLNALARQLAYSLAGIAGMLVIARMDYRRFGRVQWVYLILAATVVTLLLVHVPGIGLTRGGASRWIDLRVTSFQPTELAKVAIVIFLASSIARKGEEKMATAQFGIVPHLVVPGLIAVLLYTQPDYGSIVILAVVVAIMLYVGGARVWHLMLLAAPMVVGLAGAVIVSPYRLRRVTAVLNPWDDPQGKGYQIIQSLIAFGSGGIFGRGLGDGRQKLAYLPEIHTDFIFSNVAEEAGLVGVFLTMLFFAALVVRGMKIARRAQDPFGRYLAWGLSCLLGLEIVLNLGVVMSLLPPKGLALPFLSYGGTSMLISFAIVGLLLSISRWSDVEGSR